MKTILLVEDDPNIQQIYNNKLTKEGYNVLVVASGEEAYSYIFQEQIDLILLDIMLPGKMNGFDLLEQIKAKDETKKIPVLILTNLSTESQTALNIGAKDYIIKVETTPAQLVEKIRKYV